MNLKIRYLVIFIVLWSCFSIKTANNFSTTTIIWYMYDLPPYHILRGQYKGQGPLDYIYSVWRQSLPAYQHTTIAVNTARMVREFQSSKDFRCVTSSFIFPESVGHWVWSKPLYIEPPAVVVVRKDLANKLIQKSSVNFKQLIVDPSVKFGHFDGRIYAGEIDELIMKNINASHVLAVGSYAPGESLMRMLQRGRVDYIIEYLPEINWLMLSGQLEDDVNFVALNIEGHTALSPVHTGCVNTEWGNEVIRQLNIKIDQNMRDEIWRKYEKWLYNSFAIEHFRRVQKRYFQHLNQ